MATIVLRLTDRLLEALSMLDFQQARNAVYETAIMD